jgi:hypothetical protein
LGRRALTDSLSYAVNFFFRNAGINVYSKMAKK